MQTARMGLEPAVGAKARGHGQLGESGHPRLFGTYRSGDPLQRGKDQTEWINLGFVGDEGELGIALSH